MAMKTETSLRAEAAPFSDRESEEKGKVELGEIHAPQ
jgi:hypothetical protein